MAAPDNETITATPASVGEPKRTGVRKRHVALFVGIIAVAIGVLFGVRAYLHGRAYESTDDAQVEGDVVAISPKVAGHVAEVLIVDNQRVKQGQLLARIDPADFETAVAKAKADLAAAVAKEDQARVSLEMTSVTAHADLSGASSGVEAATSGAKASQSQIEEERAAASNAGANIRRNQALVDADEAAVKSATTTAEQKEKDYQRFLGLGKEAIISPQDVEHAQTDRDTANSALEVAKRKASSDRAAVDQAVQAQRQAQTMIQQMQSQTGQMQAMIGEAQSTLQKANLTDEHIQFSQLDVDNFKAAAESQAAQLRQAELNLSYTRIVAPTTGTVTIKSIEPGMYVQVGQPLLALVPDAVWIVANFKETQLTRIHPGEPVDLHIDAYPDRMFHGKVDSIQLGTGARFSLFPPENATGNFIKVVQRVPVKILLDGSDGPLPPLSPGMSVDPEVKVR